MENTNFSNTVLLRSEQKLLKKLRNKGTIKYSSDFDILISEGYAQFTEFKIDKIANHVPVKEYVRITDKGNRYLVHLSRDKQRFWIPVFISLAALVISIFALA
ncbi:MAG: hypothetical protein NC320_01050 [Clostridium sp.]|nr:hypothetical protein [Clostridium sp.]